jgi:hypothetical protein
MIRLMMTPDHIRAHRHCIRHREEVLGSEQCGCFYCLAIFPPSEIECWIDPWEEVGQTALCPRCEIDSVIGSASGYPITEEFLGLMNRHWF